MIVRSALLLAALATALAQTPPAFDVASVKPVDPGDQVSSYTRSNEFMGSLQALIRFAYGVEDYRISGGPKWLDSDKFSIIYPSFTPQANLKLRTLLADRFKLALHTETKELTVYALVIGKDGPKMEKAIPGGTRGSSAGAGTIKGPMEMSTFVSYLSSVVGRRVIDETGLTGAYSLSLKWTPDDQPAQAFGNAPTLTTAVQEQLGLKLESKKAPVEFLVIDHAEKPSEN